MQLLWQDLRYASRQLRQAPEFAITAVLTLALGIGMTTTVFSVVRQVLLSPLPHHEPQQLVGISFRMAEDGPNARETGNSATYLLDSGLNGGAWPASRPQLRQTVQVHAVTPQYFQTMGIPLLAGRPIAGSDEASALPSAVISAATARKWWPTGTPLGAQVNTGKMVFQIVGVAADVPNTSSAEAPVITLYVPMAQLGDGFTTTLNGWLPTSFSLRLAAGIDAAGMVQNAVASADPEAPVAKLTTMQEVIDGSIALPRFFTQLAEGFAAFGLLLTALGLFGLLSYRVTQCRREIGVRMALGATREGILAGVLTSSGQLALAGGIVGAATARLLQPLLTHWVAGNVVLGTEGSPTLLFNSNEAISLSVAALAVVTLFAALLPARRASQVEPVEALRAE